MPEIAASRLNGRADDLPVRPNEGGSMRVNGAEVRRFLISPARLDFGERPAGAVRGVRGELLLAFGRAIGVCRRAGMEGAGMQDAGVDLAGVKEKVEEVVRLKAEGLMGVPSSNLLRLEGDFRRLGSAFSLSKSSKSEGAKGRLEGELNSVGFEKPVIEALPDASGLEIKPV